MTIWPDCARLIPIMIKKLFVDYILDKAVKVLSVIVPSLKSHPRFSKILSSRVTTAAAKAGSTVAKGTRPIGRIRSFIWRSIGFFLLFGMTIFTWYGERHAATGDAISEARSVTVELPDVGKVDPAFSGKMVYATGFADTKDTIMDPQFRFKTTAIRLKREVEYYQWVETYESSGKYTYSQQWVRKPVDSSGFNDKSIINRVLKEIPSETIEASNVTLGAYKLSPSVVANMPGYPGMDFGTDKPLLLTKVPGWIPVDLSMYANALSGNFIHLRDNVIYLGRSPEAPEVADVRLIYTEVRPAEASILALVSGDTFEPFIASNGAAFNIVLMGTIEMGKMYDDISGEHSMSMLALRMLVTFVVFITILFFGAIPPVGTFLKTAFEAGRFLCALLLAPTWIILVTGASWLQFRPFSGALLLGVGVVLAFAALRFLYKRGIKQMEKERKLLDQLGNVMEQIKDGKSLEDINFNDKI